MSTQVPDRALQAAYPRPAVHPVTTGEMGVGGRGHRWRQPLPTSTGPSNSPQAPDLHSPLSQTKAVPWGLTAQLPNAAQPRSPRAGVQEALTSTPCPLFPPPGGESRAAGRPGSPYIFMLGRARSGLGYTVDETEPLPALGELAV